MNSRVFKTFLWDFNTDRILRDLKYLKGLCQGDFVVLGQVFAKIVT